MSEMPYVVIAAAGRGTRFGPIPKLLAPVGGVPCVRRVVRAVEEGFDEHRQIIVVGHAADRIVKAIGDAPHRIFLYQPSPKGTGDVLRQALKVIPRGTADAVYFFCGDKPLLKPETVRRFRQTFAASEAKMMFLVGRVELPPAQLQAHRQGRVVQIQWNGRPEVMGILEHSVLTTMRPGERKVFRDRRGRMWTFTREQLLAIREVNVSTYAWRGPELWDYVEELRDDNPQGEFFVTDLVAIYRRHGHWVSTMGLSDAKEGWGIDTVEQWWRVRDAS